MVWNLVRGEEYSSKTLYVSERNLSHVMKCISSKSRQIKSDLKRITECPVGTAARAPCQPGMTYLADDGQMRLSVEPSGGKVEIRIRHNQPLPASAIETLERCAQ